MPNATYIVHLFGFKKLIPDCMISKIKLKINGEDYKIKPNTTIKAGNRDIRLTCDG
jgi:hypothetical protein